MNQTYLVSFCMLFSMIHMNNYVYIFKIVSEFYIFDKNVILKTHIFISTSNAKPKTVSYSIKMYYNCPHFCRRTSTMKPILLCTYSTLIDGEAGALRTLHNTVSNVTCDISYGYLFIVLWCVFNAINTFNIQTMHVHSMYHVIHIFGSIYNMTWKKLAT